MTLSRMPVRLSSDIGGTFTDVVLEIGAVRRTTKVLSTPRAPEQAVIQGSEFLLTQAGLHFSDVDFVAHGATLATNAIIERRGAKVALLTTQGFRDVLEIADEGRFDQYDLFLEKPKHLVPRELRFTVPERVDIHGRVRLVLDEAAVADAAAAIAAAGAEAIAIVFLHAYANPAHEQRARDILAAQMPGMRISLSSEVSPEAREYERSSTTVCNAYVQPMMAGYLERLEAAFLARGCQAPIRLMTSGGHLVGIETASRFPIRLVESGPAGGAILAAGLAQQRSEKKILSFDMGGTTAKICLISNGMPLSARNFEIDRAHRFRKGSGLPVRIPVIEMVEIGAGGGSIAKVDGMGRIEVGPRSAGAEPGPASYGRGGHHATVTDADLAIGKIDTERFAGGAIRLDSRAAALAIARDVGKPLGLATDAAALGIAAIVDENMANAARVHAVERGLDIAEHAMIAFGGAAPLHACAVAERLGIDRIIVPEGAGVGSAIGFLEAPAAYELVRSRYMRLDRFDAAAANAHLAAMTAEAGDLAAAADARKLRQTRLAFMRYAGQGHEIAVPLPARPMRASDSLALRRLFEAAYARAFARFIPGALIEIMSWLVSVEAPRRRPAPVGSVRRRRPPAPIGKALVQSAGGGVVHARYARADLQPGMHIAGPAIVVEDGTSTVVSAAFDLTMDGGGALVLTRREKR